MSLDVVAAHHSIQCTSLHTASHTGGLDMVVKLLGMCRAEMVHKHDADARTALDYAVHKGHLEIVKILVPIPIPSFIDRDGGTPLFHAAGSANLGLVQFLLTSGADPNLPTRFGSTPLFNAANMDIVRTLLAAGANIHTQNAGSENVLPKFMSDLEMLQFFLDRGVDPNHVDDDGETPTSPRMLEESIRDRYCFGGAPAWVRSGDG
ncbi:ankyrin repeat-containing domain protein [Mycena olivaceomarginata]|nr:ankyrin repeat-containing domain protein [Mycena olivaceomarginata]